MTSDDPQLIADDYPEPSLEELGLGAPVADAPEPFHDLLAPPLEQHEDLLPLLPQRTAASQSWVVTVADAKYHWYDLVAGFPEKPDLQDPVGRQLRRLQFDLEATAEKRLVYLAVSRTRVRFDTSRATSWGFFSLKLTLPVLVGADQKRDSVTIELEVPFAATLKKPGVTVTDRFITLNWGGLIEALSIHDVLQQGEHKLQFQSWVQYVGQTRDSAGRLARGRLNAIEKIYHSNSEQNDLLLLVQRMSVAVDSSDGDPLGWPSNQNAVAADMLLKDRIDFIECALIAYFEDPKARGRTLREVEVRRERVREIRQTNNLDSVRIDLQLEDSGQYHDLVAEQVPVSRSHVIDCTIADGNVIVTRVPDQPKGKSKSR